MKQKQVTFVLMLMSIVFSCVFSAKAQKIPSFEEYEWEVFDDYEQKQEVHFILDKYYPQNDNSSDYARTKKAIAAAFKAWQQRGEFETSVDYEERLKEQSFSKFVSLCYYYTLYTLQQYEWTFVPVKYNVDKQEYTLEFYKRQEEWVDFDGDFFSVKVAIAPSEARHLKQTFERASEYSVTPFAFSLFTYYPLQCVVNGKFIPTYLIFSTEAFYFEIDNSKYPGAKEITYSAAELGINNKYLAGKKCQMNDAWKILINFNLRKEREQEEAERERIEQELQAKRELRMKDSLAIVEYNQRLESKCRKLNDLLTNNPHNVDKRQLVSKMLDINLIEQDSVSELIEKKWQEYDLKLGQDFTQCQKQIEQVYEKYKKDYIFLFENENDFESYFVKGINALMKEVESRQLYLSTKEKYLSFFQDVNDFDSYYDKGVVSVEKEVEERQILNNFKSFVNANTKQILSINCQNEKPSQYVINGKSFVTVTGYLRECKSAKYYGDMVTSLIAYNKKLHDEYAKSGSLFGSPAEFYEAYTSGNYKTILKSKK